MTNEKDKRLLLLSACGSEGETQECLNIKSHAELYGIEVHDYCPTNNEHLDSILQKGEKFDYVYLSSHGNEEGFANESRTIDYSWYDFGITLCSSMCLNQDCVVMLSCCRGGLNQVAYLLFYCCQKISYIVGPRQNTFSNEMLIGFNLLLFNVEHRQLDPIIACEKIKKGTDIRFVCFDRLETEGEFAFKHFCEQLDASFNERLNEAKEQANEYSIQTQPVFGEIM